MNALTGLGPRWRHALIAALLATVIPWAFGVCTSAAAPAQPALELSVHAAPSRFSPAKTGEFVIAVENVGTAPTSGDITAEVALSAGLKSAPGPIIPAGFPPAPAAGTGWSCPTALAGESTVTCSYSEPVRPGQSIPTYVGGANTALTVFTEVAADAGPTESAVVTVSGGGAATVTATGSAAIGEQASAFGIHAPSLTADAFDSVGQPERRAASHPARLMTTFDFTQTQQATSNFFYADSHGLFPLPIQRAKSVVVRLPPGLIGNPLAIPRCPLKLLREVKGPATTGTNCPTDSQVGVLDLELQSALRPGYTRAAVYNVAPPRGVLAAFGFAVLGLPSYVMVTLDPRDNSVIATVPGINETYLVRSQKLTLWGIPGDPVHDPNRFDPTIGPINADGQPDGDWGADFSAPVKPFLTLPSECGVPRSTAFEATSWERPDAWTAPVRSSASQVSGCDDLLFTPQAAIVPTTKAPDASSGLSAKLTFVQDEDPASLGTPPLRRLTLTLPEGMSINPASADGLGACTDAQLGLGTDDPITCPDSAKVGTVTAKSPALEQPVSGSLYLRTQNSSDPASGEMFRLALVLSDPERGLLVKLPGQVRANADTGRLETRFDDNPQLPVEDIDVRLKGGARAPLATPSTCGEKAFVGTMSSWGGQVSDLTDSFAIACPVSSVLSPLFVAGSTDPRAGVFSPFAVNIARSDGQAYVNGLSMDLAPGMLAKLKGVAVCGDAAAAAGSCAESSRIGTATVGAGSGAPFSVKGGVYLTGPYKGAPYGLAVKVHAAAGPFDLGDVIVRQALHVDRTDAHVTVVSDPLPTIVKGVPVRLRSIDVDVDRPGFTSTPTSCAAKDIAATLSSPDGQQVSLRSPYRVGECAALDLQPKLALSLSGKGQTVDGKHPAVTANLTQPAGQSNLKKVRVALPLSLALDPDNANGLCEFVDGSKPEPTCPKASIVGTATAVTPILDQPMTGPVYFVKNIRKDPKSGREIRTLPKLVIPLVGQNGLRLNLTGTSDVVDDQLVTTFDNIPDAPVSSFKLNINGGTHGILVISDADICKATQIGDQQVDGHNGKQADADVSIQTPSCPLKVLSKTVGKTSVKVKVGGLGAGKVTMTGKGIKKTSRTIAKSTVATITARRTKGKPGKVTVSFDPTGPAKPRKTTK